MHSAAIKLDVDAMHKVSEVNSEEMSATDKDTPAGLEHNESDAPEFQLDIMELQFEPDYLPVMKQAQDIEI